MAVHRDDDLVRAMKMFWVSDDPNTTQSDLVYVKDLPGKKKSKNGGSVEKKGKSQKKTPKSNRKSHNDLENTNNSNLLLKTKENNKRTASFKDLCVEDKKRVANLINELGRLGEEKDKFSSQLSDERIRFQNQMKELLLQQEHILKEREAIQVQLQECQSLLAKYQTHLLVQVEKKDKDVGSKNEVKKPQKKKRRSKMKHSDETTNSSFQSFEDKDWNEEKFISTSYRQHSNYNGGSSQCSEPIKATRSGHTKADVGSAERVSRQRENGQASSHETLSTPTGTRNWELASNPASRPFTNMIDKLIAEERETVSSTSHQSRTIAHELEPNKRPLLGPLSTPVMTSTQRTDDLDSAMTHFSSQPKCEDFKPLLPDNSPRSSLHSVGSQQGYNSDSNGCNGSDPGTLGQSEGQSNHVTFGQSSSIGHIKEQDKRVSMKPQDRKHLLLEQKAALLEEQQRLKRILTEQEELLQSKQQQLHYQQQLQRQRLEFFEQTGYFPANSPHQEVNGPRDQQNQAEYPRSTLDQPSYQFPLAALQTGHGTVYPHQSSQPAQIPGHYMPLESSAHTQGAFTPYHRHYNSIGAGIYTGQGIGYQGANSGVYNGASQQSPATAAEALSESAENLNFLEMHGIDVLPLRRDYRKAGLELPEMRSAATSPLRPTANHVPHYSTSLNSGVVKQENELLDLDLRNHQHHSQSHSGMNGTFSPLRHPLPPPSQGDNSYLLDLVDQVEGLHQKIHEPLHYNKAQEILYHTDYHPMVNSSALSTHMGLASFPPAFSNGDTCPIVTSDIEQESRMLEEVFFVK